jgi:hypothetical protein
VPDSYPYTISNNKIGPVFARIQTAAKPERVSQALLAQWGFTASNDRAMLRVLRDLRFINENGAPTAAYDSLRDHANWKYTLADQIRICYADLYAIDPNFHALSEAEIKSTMMRITGKDEESAKRYFATFKTLASLANFSPRPGGKKSVDEKPADEAATPKVELPLPAPPPAPATSDHSRRKTEYHYNIQIHLPVTSDISVYNAIFKSLKENLDV